MKDSLKVELKKHCEENYYSSSDALECCENNKCEFYGIGDCSLYYVDREKNKPKDWD